jgi:hypothetical protein
MRKNEQPELPGLRHKILHIEGDYCLSPAIDGSI